MSRATSGLWAVAGASGIWGLAPVYFAALGRGGVGPAEVLAHRGIWSLGVFALVLAVQGRLGELRRALRGRALGQTLLAAALVSLNWYLFIWGIDRGKAVEASLGYYILPLAMAALGALVLREPLRRSQKVALGLATLAVALLGWGLGAAPWLALALGVSFALYALVKRRAAVGPIASVTAETVVIALPALAYLGALHHGLWGLTSGGHFFGPQTGLLMGLGVLTGLPLILFSTGAQRAPLALVGLVMYLNPTLQLATAALALGGVVTLWHWLALGLIWTGLALVSADGLRQGRSAASR